MVPPWRVVALASAVMLPPLVYVLVQTSSMAVGTSTASLVAVMANRRFLSDAREVSAAAAIALICCFIVGVHVLIIAVVGNLDLARSLASLVLLAVVVVGAKAVSHAVFRAPEASVRALAATLFWTLALVALVASAGLRPPVPGLPEKAAFPFNEPSHFALAFSPFLLFTLVRGRSPWRACVLVGGLALGYELENLTLVAAIVLAGAVTLRPAWALFLAVAVTAVAMRLDLGYFAARLDFGEDSKNLSVLVYLQGWEMIRETLSGSARWGIGFQQLGAVDMNLWTSALITSIRGDDLNLRDGGFLVAKIVSEFGWIGALISMMLLAFCARTALRLREVALGRRQMAAAEMLASCIVVSFVLDLLVRSNGYFTGSSFLFAAALMHLRAIRRHVRPAQEAAGHGPGASRRPAIPGAQQGAS